MTIDTMRFIDYYAGVPLCFLASAWVKICDFFSFGRKNMPPKRVLFVELSEMGSTILADPALRWTKNQGAEIYFAIFKRNAVSLRMLNTVPAENVFLLREDNFLIFTLDTLRFLFWARRKKIDVLVDLELFSRFTSLLTALSGCHERVGFHAFHNEGLYRGAVLTKKVAYNPHIHIAKNFMALVKTVFQQEKDIPFYKGPILDTEIVASKAQISGDSIARVKTELSKVGVSDASSIVLLNCAGGEFLLQRRWPPENYAKLAKMILEKNPNVRILLTGAPSERAELDAIRSKAQHDHCINFAGSVRFEDLPALYSLSKVLVTNDSGPAHFASTTEIPTYVFFGPETPLLYGSLGNFTPIYANFACSPCVSAFNHRKTPCTNNRCVQVITPEQVYNMVQKCF